MNKYYTPEITEFHVGFEYECYQRDNWEKFEVRENFFGIDHRILKKMLMDGEIRVKHLDSDDIENLGFEFKGKGARLFFRKECLFHLPDTDSFKCTCLMIQLDEKYRTIKIEGYITSACEEETLFTGTIKNKSELSRILKMIGYE